MPKLYRVFRTDFVSPLPKWVISLLLGIKENDFIQPSIKKANIILDEVESEIYKSGHLDTRRRYKVKHGENCISVINDSGKEIFRYGIEEYKFDYADD